MKDRELDKALALLGVRRDVTDRQLRTVGSRLAFRYHPDMGGDVLKFTEVWRAVEIVRKHVAATTKKPTARCAACRGVGSIKVMQGFRTMKIKCTKCKGKGSK